MTYAPRPDKVAALARQPLAMVVRMHTYRKDALARMQEHGMPRVIIDTQVQLVAEAAAALRQKGVL